MLHAVVIEKAENNYSAYVPDLPGCVATGATVEEADFEYAKPLRFIWKVCAKTGCLFRPYRAASSTLK